MLSRLFYAGIAIMFISSAAASDSLAGKLARQENAQARIMWFDAEANMWELSTRAGVADMVGRCKAANINTIIVDVKPLAGLVLYNSKIAPRVTVFKGKPYPQDYDLLQTVVEEGHKAGIPVYAAVNVFSEGSQNMQGGPAHSRLDWQCVQYEVEYSLSASGAEPIRLGRPNTALKKGEVCLYGASSEAAGKLPANTYYVRVAADGTPIQAGKASGNASISAPDGGCVLLGSGKAAKWLQQIVDSKRRFHLSTWDALVRAGELGDMHHAVFVNPSNPQVREYAISIIKEICSNYEVDGIVLDRMRYPNIYTDFSETTRAEFEKQSGCRVTNWPQDILTRTISAKEGYTRGPLFKDWLKFRAKTMRSFVIEARSVVKVTRPQARLGVYVGSWYPVYYDVGVNWGSPKNAANYEWWPEGYETTGYADQVDFLCTGCYYESPSRKEAVAAGLPEWMSVEASAQESTNAVKDETFVYASLYLLQYDKQPEQFLKAIRECLANSQGCMLFDLVYARNYDWWAAIRAAFPDPTKAPHDVAGLLDRLRPTGQREAGG